MAIYILIYEIMALQIEKYIMIRFIKNEIN
jgi:hypothetical protein